MGKINRRVVGALLAGALFAFVLAGASLADHGYTGAADSHYLTDGNASCPEGTTVGGSIHVETPANGTYNNWVTISDYNGQSFDWALTPTGDDLKEMAAVVVNGGPNAIVYVYDFNGNGNDNGDVGLTAPLDPNAGEGQPAYYPIHDIYFCFDIKDDVETGGLIVKKVVVNSDVSPSAFSFSVGGATYSFLPGGENLVLLPTGEYNVTEPPVAGFDTTYSNCTGLDVGPNIQPPTCTITNTATEQPEGKLIVRKVVVGSDTPVSSFSFSVGGLTTPFAEGDNDVVLPAGTYDVTEPAVDGFATTYENCSQIVVGPDVEPTPICTITNTAEQQPPGSLIVRKVVSGSSDSPSTFSFTVNGETHQFESDGQNVIQLPDGTYDVTEPQANENGFKTTYSGCDDVQVSSTQQQTPVCTITNSKGDTPPPFVPPPTPKLDVWVQKGATPQVTLVNGSGTINYDLVVSNNGPNQANDVTLNDSAPAGVTFGAITGGPSQGSCSISPTALSCSFGTVGPGTVVTLSFTATVTATGTYGNTACVDSAGNADTNKANNCSTANTVVVAPITPPVTPPVTPKPPKPAPKPKPKPNVCAILTISTRTLSAGKYTGVAVKVTRSGKAVGGAKVRFKGPGIFKTVKTRKTGLAVTKLRPAKSGIVRVSIVNKKACSAKRIGVLGTFQPPVTG
jgi:uncharacterized repeat protein (TIGR01451 family)